jgi:two-component system phosphate regulon sensor histidine kinase PhoR
MWYRFTDKQAPYERQAAESHGTDMRAVQSRDSNTETEALSVVYYSVRCLMKKYTIRWIIGLISIALLGLMCVQLYWVNNAIDLKKELFRQSVNGAMSAVVSRLEKREVASAVAQTVNAIPEPEELPEPVEQPPAPPKPISGTIPASAEQAARRTAAGQRHNNDIAIQVEPTFYEEASKARGKTFYAVQPTLPRLRATTQYSLPPNNQQGIQQSIDSRLKAMNQYSAALANNSRQQLNRLRATATQDTVIQCVNIDSIRNTMRVILDSGGTRQTFFIDTRAPQRVAVTYNTATRPSRSSSIAVRTRPANGSVSVRTRSSDGSMGSVNIPMPTATIVNVPETNVSWNFNFDNLEEQTRQLEAHVQHLQEAFEGSFPTRYMMEDMDMFFETPPPSSNVWVYANTDNEKFRSQTVLPQQKIVHSDPVVPASGTYTARPVAPKVQQPVSRPVRDRLVSIKDMASRVLVELASGSQPIEQRVSPHLIDSLLKVELAQRGIALPFKYAVLKNDNSFTFARPATYTGELQHSAFRTALYPNDIITEPHFLSIYFPRQDEFVYESMWGVLATSLAFILLILCCFSFTVMTLFRQKKLSDMKTDFINNMTHEFKTPIATISLASEALRDPAVRGNDNRVMRFINAIHEENKRLGTQVERVLQAAVIDRGEVQLNVAPTAVHEVLQQVLQTVALQIESRGGSIECHLEAESDVIEADRVHLANVIINLLDNANKYSPELPVIKLSTHNELNGIVISVEDNGMGMSRDAQKKIFDKFYRVPTGNLHDVKGFGLGLSYVKAMVEAHGGSISVRSELRHGSCFDLYFPYTVQEAVVS